MGVARGYVVALSIWVLGVGCHHMSRDSATGQSAGASNAGSFAAGRGRSGGAARTNDPALLAPADDPFRGRSAIPGCENDRPHQAADVRGVPRTAPARAAADS